MMLCARHKEIRKHPLLEFPGCLTLRGALGPAQAAGLSRATPRAAWPPELLRGVFLDLARDAPRDLVSRELWAAASSAADAWRRRGAFRQSAVATSIVRCAPPLAEPSDETSPCCMLVVCVYMQTCMEHAIH